jgi:hypothetical protein
LGVSGGDPLGFAQGRLRTALQHPKRQRVQYRAMRRREAYSPHPSSIAVLVSSTATAQMAAISASSRS